MLKVTLKIKIQFGIIIKKIIELRKNSIYKDLFIYGEYKQIDLINPNIYIYERFNEKKKVVVINSF